MAFTTGGPPQDPMSLAPEASPASGLSAPVPLSGLPLGELGMGGGGGLAALLGAGGGGGGLENLFAQLALAEQGDAGGGGQVLLGQYGGLDGGIGGGLGGGIPSYGAGGELAQPTGIPGADTGSMGSLLAMLLKGGKQLYEQLGSKGGTDAGRAGGAGGAALPFGIDPSIFSGASGGAVPSMPYDPSQTVPFQIDPDILSGASGGGAFAAAPWEMGGAAAYPGMTSAAEAGGAATGVGAAAPGLGSYFGPAVAAGTGAYQLSQGQRPAGAVNIGGALASLAMLSNPATAPFAWIPTLFGGGISSLFGPQGMTPTPEEEAAVRPMFGDPTLSYPEQTYAAHGMQAPPTDYTGMGLPQLQGLSAQYGENPIPQALMDIMRQVAMTGAY